MNIRARQPAGATIALFLSNMAQSVEVMPDLYTEMRSMTDLDSTMGEAGRMMPWNW